MNYRDKDFIQTHMKSILDFYAPNIVDPTGGFHHNFLDDGSVFDPEKKHLVSSTRLIFNYCKAFETFGDPEHQRLAQRGVDYVRAVHWDSEREGYNWILKNHNPIDQTNHCYGLAFVMLASAAAHQIGIDGALEDMLTAERVLWARLWDERAGLFADEATADWQEVAPYRGQNSNMHATEAYLAAFEATGRAAFLDRALHLARKVTVELAGKSDGLIWEHYTETLEIDWDYNKDDPKNIYRPWGYQPGHHTEWAKLLLMLHGHRPETWLLDRAQTLIDTAFKIGWDNTNGGLFYGVGPGGEICDSDKYFWVQSETLPALVRLAAAADEAVYMDWYDRLWAYADRVFIDHENGGWYRILTADNRKYSNEKSTAGAKCDYHTIGACWDLLQVLP